jgi:hypothetical protein
MLPGTARPVLAALAILWISACGREAGSDDPALEVVRDTVADTVVVRTLSGSVWGGDARLVPEVEIGVLEGAEEYMFGSVVALGMASDGSIYVVDRQVPALRVYGPDGVHRATWGREGGGPGEFSSPDGGLAVLNDGRVAVRDPGNARLQIFDPDGTPLDTWPVIPGGFSTSNPMFRTSDDVLMTPTVMDLEVDLSEWRTGLIRIDAEGAVLDTVPVPEVHENDFIEARVEGNVSRNTVPFSPGEHWAVHPDGYFVHGVADTYSFTLLREGDPLRIERAADPVPVTPGERSQARTRATRNLRMTDPNWRWNGPEIPRVKPAFRELYVGSEGRIWVMRYGPGLEGDDPDYDPEDPDDVEMRWSEPVLFDLFEDDGTFLGTVHGPTDFSPYPTPVFSGDQVVAVTRDDLGVQRVVRFRIQQGEGGDRDEVP